MRTTALRGARCPQSARAGGTHKELFELGRQVVGQCRDVEVPDDEDEDHGDRNVRMLGGLSVVTGWKYQLRDTVVSSRA